MGGRRVYIDVSKIERGPKVAPEARRAPGATRAPHLETGPTCARGQD